MKGSWSDTNFTNCLKVVFYHFEMTPRHAKLVSASHSKHLDSVLYLDRAQQLSMEGQWVFVLVTEKRK